MPKPPEGMMPAPARLEQDFDDGTLYALRSAVAAHEMAANAVRHGAGHGHLRLHAADGILACQVSDNGPRPPGQDDKPDAGTAPWPAEHSHGLWLIGEVADQFTIDHGPDGTTATATFTLSPPRPPRAG